MARLNEPPAPTESFDALKRRFIRQNREIARCNSAQSLRIRNLESEISRLLAENVTLREQAINLKHELEKRDASTKVTDQVLQLKAELEEKLSEVTSLVSKLGDATKAPRKSHSRRSLIGETARSPQREWRRNSQFLAAMQEGRLPPILEDKQYPRRTMSGDGLSIVAAGMATDISDSPDLGPPPVAHFDVPEPIKFDRSPAKETREKPEDNSEGMSMVDLSSNLERRRKRRASSLLEDIMMEDQLKKPEPEPTTDKEPEKTQSESRVKATRKTTKAPSIPSVAAQENWILESKAKAKDQDNRDLIIDNDFVARKPLETKSSNSPSKPRRTISSDKVTIVRDDISKTAQAKAQRERRTSSGTHPTPLTIYRSSSTNSLEQQSELASVSTEEQPLPTSLPPKTPAPMSLDILSPTSFEAPSTGKPTGTVTSEMAMTTASLEDIVSNPRGSRRARAAVSYAEPKLNVKMRRPGKELVDAVIVNRSKGPNGKLETSAESEFEVKQEKEEHSSWKDLPLASSENKADGNRFPLEEEPEPEHEPGSPLVSKTDRSKPKTTSSKTDDVDALIATTEAKLSIYDPPCSPEPDPIPVVKQAEPISEPATAPAPAPAASTLTSTATSVTRRPSRRHSTAPGTSSTLSTRPSSLASSRRTTDLKTISGSSSRLSSTSSSSALRKRTFDEPTTAAIDAAGLGQRKNSAVSSATTTAATTTTTGLGSRRRSMMV